MSPSPGSSVRACQECNRKKTKCDMQQPSCGLCNRTSTACIFPSRRKTPSARKPTGISKAKYDDGNLARLLSFLVSNPDVVKELAHITHSSSSSERLDTVDEPLLGAPLKTHRPQEASRSIAQTPYAALPTPSPSIKSHSRPLRTPGDASSARISLEHARSSEIQGPDPLNISYHLVINLIDLFFEKVQPWMPLLHKPTFRQEYIAKLNTESRNCLDQLRDDEALLLYSICAMSARFSTFADLKHVPALHRGDEFGREALRLCGNPRGIFTPTLTYLQGCIVLAFYFYTAGLSTQGWMLAGICIRLAYELELADIDEHEQDLTNAFEWVQKEKLRRAWWLVWELDTFGSTVCRRPYAVDRRRMSVKLPVSDEAWFSGIPAVSSKLLTCPGQAWKSLQNCPNQDERAWFLVANHLMSVVTNNALQEPGILMEEKLAIENDVSCFKLALPPVFRGSSPSLCSDSSSFAQNNWVVGTQLMLSSMSYRVGSIPVRDMDDSGSVQGNTYALLRTRVLELCQIARRWVGDDIVLAHPFFACSMLPAYVRNGQKSTMSSLLSSYEDLALLVLGRFAEKWKLGSLMHGMAKLINKSENMAADEIELARRYPIYFPGWSKIIHVVPSLDSSLRNGADITNEDAPSKSGSSNAVLQLPEPNNVALDGSRVPSEAIINPPLVETMAGFDFDFEFPSPMRFFPENRLDAW